MEPNQQDDFGGIAKFPIDKKSYGRQSVDYSKKENGFSLLEPSPSNSSAGVIPVRSMRLPPLQANPTPLSAMKLPPIQGTSSLVSTQMPLAPPIQPPPMMPPERIMSPPGQGQYERIVVKNSTITTEPPTPMGWKMSDPSATETKSFTQNTITKLTTYSALTTPATPLPAISEPAKKPSSSLQVNNNGQRRKPSSYRVAFKCFFICLFLSIPIVIFIIMMALSGGFSPSNSALNLNNSTAPRTGGNNGALPSANGDGTGGVITNNVGGNQGNFIPNGGTSGSSGGGTIPVQVQHKKRR